MERTARWSTVRRATAGTTTLVGDLWPNVNGNSARLTWNSFDIPGCDGTPEPLSAGRGLLFCGEAFGTVDAMTIRAHLIGNVFIDDAAGVRQKVCSGMQVFTFTRVTAEATRPNLTQPDPT